MYDNHNTFLETLHSGFMEEKENDLLYNKDIHPNESHVYTRLYIDEWKA